MENLGPAMTYNGSMLLAILVDLYECMSLIAGLDSPLEHGTETWDWKVWLERGTGLLSTEICLQKPAVHATDK